MKAPLTPQRGELKSHSINQKPSTKNKLKVVELFAGVGGFRIAMEGYPKKHDATFEVIWSNQYEPRTSVQHANLVYKNRFKDGIHSEEDIEELVKSELDSIPKHDVLVGGFPCQDFSIANRTHNKGIEGKKGKLWWAIDSILKAKRPRFILLENVNRLLSSPASKKGRDFAIILHCLNALGYAVEWRVINAANYGFAQRRRRVFIIGIHKSNKLYKTLEQTDAEDWLLHAGIAASAFPVQRKGKLLSGSLPKERKEIQHLFSKDASPFQKAGLMIDGNYYTLAIEPNYAA